jgi:hypothetical protein
VCIAHFLMYGDRPLTPAQGPAVVAHLGVTPADVVDGDCLPRPVAERSVWKVEAVDLGPETATFVRGRTSKVGASHVLDVRVGSAFVLSAFVAPLAAARSPEVVFG